MSKMSKSNNINKALIWAMLLALSASSLTACAGSNDGDTEHKADSSITDTLGGQEIENETESEAEDNGIFVEYNADDYSVDESLDDIYKENEISTDDITNVNNEDSGLYFEINLGITDEIIDSLMDSTGAYVANLDTETLSIVEYGDSAYRGLNTINNEDDTDNTEPDTSNTSNTKNKLDDTKLVLIVFGDKNLVDREYIKQAFSTKEYTRTVFVKGKFRGRTALYPMLVESSTGEVYVYKPYLEMSDTW